jgi:hypothetical protein
LNLQLQRQGPYSETCSNLRHSIAKKHNLCSKNALCF